MKKLLNEWFNMLVEPFVRSYKLLSDAKLWKNIIKVIVIVLLPIIFIYGIVYLVLLIMSLIFWVLPVNYPIPFYHPLMGMAFDRFLILMGFILLFIKN